MSVQPHTRAAIEQTHGDESNPLDELESDSVLRCQDPETGWEWYYDVDADGSVIRYHELEDYAAVPVPRLSAVETAALESVGVTEVSEVHLDVRTGERE
ncbi:hypothetical protein [Natronorubrum halophilum]|uniref:hypothetical protein n=1 Tax=Natronorubrum halophilum TaxID=1702106 RepID=UPI001EE8F0E2|nr:hypothetical protein [Natronorubrum halophilum]